MTQNNDKELQFVIEHYKEDAMDMHTAWKRLKETKTKTITKTKTKGGFARYAVAASAVLVTGMAVACGVWMMGNAGWSWRHDAQQNADAASGKVDTAKVFHYDKTPINSVLGDMASCYKVALTASDTTKCVSGEIEASNLQDVIDILETSLNIEICRK